MPRRSAADLSVVRPRVDGRPTRLIPPADLEADERKLFVELVTACAPDHFRQSDMPMLVQYVRESCTAERAAIKMKETGGEVTDRGTINPWFGVLQRATRMMALLSARLRLNPQSRSHPRSIARQAGWRPPSAYEMLDFEDDDRP
jgi:phage terminase small subunit